MRIAALIPFYMPFPDDISNLKEIKNIIFDLDGTLIDSSSSILSAMSQTLKHFSYKPIKSLDSSLIGPPLRDTLKIISGEVDSEKLTHLVKYFKKSYDNEAYALSTSYPGINELLDALFLSGKKLYIATNKRMIPTRKLIDFFGWEKYFENVYAIDKNMPSYSNKSHMLFSMIADLNLYPANCVYIGDHMMDAKAADLSALPFVYANWGYGPSGNEIQDLCVAKDPKQLLELLCGKIEDDS